MTEIPERLVPGSPSWDRYYCEHRQRYEFFASLVMGKNVLDAACGVGYGSQILALAGAKHVTGVDIAPDAIREAKANFYEANTSYQEADVTDLPFPDGSFEAVISFETIEHLQSPRSFVQELNRVLKPGGLLIISTPNRFFGVKTSKPNPYHVSEMSFSEFTDLIGEFFVIQKKYTQTHSPRFIRHLRLLDHLNHMDRAIRHSTLLKFEKSIRRLLNKWTVDLPPIPAALEDTISDDFVIFQIQDGQPQHLTFILEATRS